MPAAVLAGHRPAVWVSDLFTAQRGHGMDWQICLAQQLRDLQFAIDTGDAIFAPCLKALLKRAIEIGHRRPALAPATLKQYRYSLERRLDAIMVTQPTTPDGRRLRKRYLADRSHLFTFITDPQVPPTNNGSERDLRPSVIFRKSLPRRRPGSPTASGPSGAPIAMPPSAPSSTPDAATTSTPSTPFVEPWPVIPSTPSLRPLDRLPGLSSYRNDIVRVCENEFNDYVFRRYGEKGSPRCGHFDTAAEAEAYLKQAEKEITTAQYADPQYKGKVIKTGWQPSHLK